MKTSRFLVAAAVACAALALNADFREERLSRTYQAAMADYSAGRLDAAMAGFAKTIAADGDNASARFQLACLQHDYKRDYLAAICNYKEYLRLEGSSDKASLARERIALCEAELARELAKKYDLAGGEALLEESRKARAELADAEKQLARGAKEYEEAQKRIATLQQENSRLRRMVTAIGEDDASSATAKSTLDLASAKSLAEDEDSALAPDPALRAGAADAASLAEDEDEKTFAGLESAKALLAEADEDENAPGSSDLIPADAAPAPAGARLSDLGKTSAAPAAPASPQERPATYKVEEGDTLYKIALRFYGKTSAWKQIRDANKATISTDGRVNTGQVIVLP